MCTRVCTHERRCICAKRLMDAISLVSSPHPWYLRMAVSDLCNKMLKHFSKTFSHSVSFSLEYAGSACLILWCWKSWLVSLSPWPHYMVTWFYFLAIWEKKSLFLTLLFSPTPCGTSIRSSGTYYVISFYKSRVALFVSETLVFSVISLQILFFWRIISGDTCACFRSSLPSLFLLIVVLLPFYPWVIIFSTAVIKHPIKATAGRKGLFGFTFWRHGPSWLRDRKAQ